METPDFENVVYIDEYPQLEEICRLRREAGRVALCTYEEVQGKIVLFELPDPPDRIA